MGRELLRALQETNYACPTCFRRPTNRDARHPTGKRRQKVTNSGLSVETAHPNTPDPRLRRTRGSSHAGVVSISVEQKVVSPLQEAEECRALKNFSLFFWAIATGSSTTRAHAPRTGYRHRLCDPGLRSV